MSKRKKKPNRLTEYEEMAIRQNSKYSDEGKAEPDNNIFWVNGSNPLSSKGN